VKRTILLLLAGGGFGWWLAYKTGKAVARAQRAWRDWRATVKSVRGLWASTVEQWRKALWQMGIAAVVAFGLLGVLYVAVTR